MRSDTLILHREDAKDAKNKININILRGELVNRCKLNDGATLPPGTGIGIIACGNVSSR
jgi:hypothetical protein